MSNLATRSVPSHPIIKGDANCPFTPLFPVSPLRFASALAVAPEPSGAHSLTLTGSGDLPYSPPVPRPQCRRAGVDRLDRAIFLDRRMFEWSGCADCDDHERMSKGRAGVEAPPAFPPERGQDRSRTS
jgi:hypothetical protein